MSDLARRFIAEGEALGATAVGVADAAGLADAILTALRQWGARRVMLARHPLLAGIGLDAAPLDWELQTWGDRDPAATRAYLSTCDAAVAVGLLAIAETGSVLLAAGPGQGRTLTVVPPCLLLVVPLSGVTPDLPSAFARLRTDTAPVPPVVTLVTGPSRSADIENDLSIGVHGPGCVHVVLARPQRP